MSFAISDIVESHDVSGAPGTPLSELRHASYAKLCLA